MTALTRVPGPARPHAVVIGSGFGGLAAAIRLGARGYRVTVLERLPSNPAAGRRCSARTGSCSMPGRPSITAPFLLEELWAAVRAGGWPTTSTLRGD